MFSIIPIRNILKFRGNINIPLLRAAKLFINKRRLRYYFNSYIHLIIKIYDAYYIFVNERYYEVLCDDLKDEQMGYLSGRSAYVSNVYPLNEINKTLYWTNIIR